MKVHPYLPVYSDWRAAVALAAGLLALASCATTGNQLPPPRPADAVQVLVPVPTHCEVQKVTSSLLPTSTGIPADLYEAVKRVLADRAILIGDRERLVAANSDPCPERKTP